MVDQVAAEAEAEAEAEAVMVDQVAAEAEADADADAAAAATEAEAEADASFIKRRSSKLPARNRSYRTLDGGVVQQEGADNNNDNDNANANNNNKYKCADTMISSLHTFASISSWVPLILTFFVKDFRIMFLSGFVIALFNVLVVNLTLYKFGKTRTWPKMLDVIFASMFGILTIVAFAYPESTEFLKNFAGVIINACLAIGIGSMWFVFSRPFIKDFAADEVGIEALTHPVIIIYIRIVTSVWLGVFTICALISLPPGIILLNGERDPHTAFIVSNVLSPIIVVCGMIFSYWIFPKYFYSNMDKFANPYEKEIDEWNLKHPDHEYAVDDAVGEDIEVAA